VAGIVLEDDCVADPTFFAYCAALLARYERERRIMLISGNDFLDGAMREHSYYFLKTGHIWGWASWRDRWRLLDIHVSGWPQLRAGPAIGRFLKRRATSDYWRLLVDDLHGGARNSWSSAIIHAMVKHDLLAISPRRNLVSNIGFGTSGTHVTPEDHRYSRLPTAPMAFPLVHPPAIRLSVDFDDYVERVWDVAPSGEAD